MATRLEIKCINKSDRFNPHERILSIGGVHPNGERWKMVEMVAIHGMKTGMLEFWTRGGGKTAEIIVSTHLGRDYLKTVNDGIQPDNLLALPECP